MKDIDDACSAVREIVDRTGNEHDRAYFRLHEARFRKTAERISGIVPPGASILDVGSHYLHQAAVLKQMGYDVSAMDVPDHAGLPFVAGRARSLGIVNYEVSGDEFSA